jgi:hypothetical protein
VWAERLIQELDEKGYRAFIEETVIPKKGHCIGLQWGDFPPAERLNPSPAG